MTEKALYYPYIDINSPALIRSAALYWDEIHTIVPERIEEPFKNKWSIEASELGFLKKHIVNSNSSDVNNAGAEISSDLSDYYDETKKSYEQIEKEKEFGVYDEINDKKRARIHMGKLPDDPDFIAKLYSITKDERLQGINNRDGLGDWLLLPKPFVKYYMSKLAGVISESNKNDYTPITDSFASQESIIQRYGFVEDAQITEEILVRTSLDMICINQSVPLENVYQFRKNNRDKLLSLQGYIKNLARNTNATNFESYIRQLNDIMKYEIVPRKKEIEAHLSEKGIPFAKSRFSFPVVTTVTATTLLTGSFTAGLANWSIGTITEGFKARGERKKIISNNPLSYLFMAQKDLNKS
jgi:hypothetical protein